MYIKKGNGLIEQYGLNTTLVGAWTENKLSVVYTSNTSYIVISTAEGITSAATNTYASTGIENKTVNSFKFYSTTAVSGRMWLTMGY